MIEIFSSQTLEEEVAVEFLEAAVPEEYSVVDGDLQHSIHDKSRDLLKMTLAKRDMPRINIARFERSEQ